VNSRVNRDGGNHEEKLTASILWTEGRIEENLAKSFHRSWFYFLLDSEDLEGMITDHGRISDG
jgi:hypothetical protein